MSDEKMESEKKESVLKNILEFGGALIILCIVFLFIILSTVKSCNQDEGKVYIDTLHVSKINFFEIPIKKKDTNFIVMDKSIIVNLKLATDSINSKIKQVNKVSVEINKVQKENSENYRLYLTLIGSVFAIVGFFGFKSIHDTRQSAIEKAVNDAKNEAVKEARETAKNEAKMASMTEARNVSNDVSNDVAQKVAQKTAEKEVNRYLSENLQKLFNQWEITYKASIQEQYIDILDDINQLKNPIAYGIVDEEMEKLKKKLLELEEKQSELLTLMIDIKLKFLKA